MSVVRFRPEAPSLHFAGVAQLAEQLICNQQVAGSIPVTSSINLISMGRFPSGQREQTVNLSSVTSVVRIHLFPPKSLVFTSDFFVATYYLWIRIKEKIACKNNFN